MIWFWFMTRCWKHPSTKKLYWIQNWCHKLQGTRMPGQMRALCAIFKKTKKQSAHQSTNSVAWSCKSKLNETAQAVWFRGKCSKTKMNASSWYSRGTCWIKTQSIVIKHCLLLLACLPTCRKGTQCNNNVII